MKYMFDIPEGISAILSPDSRTEWSQTTEQNPKDAPASYGFWQPEKTHPGQRSKYHKDLRYAFKNRIKIEQTWLIMREFTLSKKNKVVMLLSNGQLKWQKINGCNHMTRNRSLKQSN